MPTPRPSKRPRLIYARFAEILPNGRGRVHDGKRWIAVDPREIRRAVAESMLDEAMEYHRDTGEA